MLTDPTGGIGYAFGAKLPSTHMTTIATELPRALDIVQGGTYTCANALTTTHNAPRTTTYNDVDTTTHAKLCTHHFTDGGDAHCVVANLWNNALIHDAVGGANVDVDATVDFLSTATFSGNAFVPNGSDFTWGSTNYPQLVGRDITYSQPIEPAEDSGSFWQLTGGGGFDRYWLQTDVATVRLLYFPLTRLPSQGDIHTVTVYVKGSAGGNSHGANKPATMPAVELRMMNLATGAPISLGAATDGSVSAAAYDAYHPISFSIAGGSTIDVGTVYYLVVYGEAGLHSVANSLGVVAASVACTCTKVAPG